MTHLEEIRMAREVVSALLHAEDWPEAARSATTPELEAVTQDAFDAPVGYYTAQIILGARRFMSLTSWALSPAHGACRNEDCQRHSRENDILRGMVARSVQPGQPCHYCGVDSVAKCPRGFPGCGLADDIMCGDDAYVHSLLQRVREQGAKIEELTKSDAVS